MSDVLAEIQVAMNTVERTLDLLTANGKDELAFALSKAHFGARVRTSWPASLAPMISALKRVHEDPAALTPAQRDDVARAIATLERVIDT